MGGGFIITGKSYVQDVWNTIRDGVAVPSGDSGQASALEDVDDVVPLENLAI